MEATQRKITIVVASLVLLAAGIILWRTIQSSATKFNPAPFIGVGQVLAEDTAKAMEEHGRVVAVIVPDHQQPDGPLHAEWEAFRRELQKHNAITLAATETIAPDPDDLEPGVGCPISAFKGILERHNQTDAIVFFMGLPAWHWLEEKKLSIPSGTAKTIVLDNVILNPKRHYEQYFAQGFLSELIILRREDRSGQVTKPKTPREWFNNEYQIITPQNYESLPAAETPIPLVR